MPEKIRIGTRDSKLAVWQATHVKEQLALHGWEGELVYIKSEGDINLTTPLYELGVQGIFTKALDIALLEKQIDIAVHSYKDIPTQVASGLRISAVLPRANPFDVLVSNRPFDASLSPMTIATSSIRRKTQWLFRYPGSSVENLRGNVQTRLQKLKDSTWSGAIFAAAGLERLGLTAKETGPQLVLDWMVPAPAQGAMAIVGREGEPAIQQACALLNDYATQTCTQVERDFLRMMQGGCSTPISALATITDQIIFLKANICSPDGTESIEVNLQESLLNQQLLAGKAATALLDQGVRKWLKT